MPKGVSHQPERIEADVGGRFFLPWLKGYRGADAVTDAVAGLTLASYMLPAAIGDASLAGLPPESGLYACILSGLVFWFLCGSRHTAITVTSAISLLLGVSLAPLAGGDPTRHAALAACATLLVSALALIAWLCRAGFLVNFVSESVMLGFKVGVALTLASSQLPKLFGVSGGHGAFWERSTHFARHAHEAHAPALAVGLAALAILILGKVFFRRAPVALLVVAGGIAASAMLGLADRGVRMLGEVPQGLPSFALPAVRLDDLNDLLPLAMACFLLGAVETAAIGRMFAAKHGRKFDANRELLALAGANLASGVARGMPVSGGMSQSLVNESAGARSPASGLFAALALLAVALFLSGLLRNLPEPALAAIVLMAVVGLVNVRAISRLWRHDKAELAIAAAALAGVLASGLLRGVLIGAVISMILLIRRASRPHVATLGRIPGSRRFSDMERHPDNEAIPGVVVVRPEASIVYFNAEHIREAALAAARARGAEARTLVLDMSASPMMDLAGAEIVLELEGELRAKGVRLILVEARASVRDRLRDVGLEDRIGRIDRFTTVADAIDAVDGRMTAQAGSAGASPGADR